jgi:hypothetical protein
VVDCLPSKCEALSSNTNTAKKTKNKKNPRENPLTGKLAKDSNTQFKEK